MQALICRLTAAVAAVTLVALSLVGAGVTSAHATVIATDPADGAPVAEAPARVSATFSEAMQPAFAAMTVVGPDGNLWSTGAPQVQDTVVSVNLRPLGPAGVYTVNYRATSADGHVVTGSWTFELTAGGTGTPGPSAAADAPPVAPAEDPPVWPFIVGACVAVGAAALWTARRRT
ncbi:copper resistance CopC family protein [Mycolicibacterium doricum]|uniref:Copper resistance protein CopC n=1 Tax=Mycolicibacterium doricum TaxID=126673 RepID=A0A1X1THW4_9MYCO|nr:copper resistance CopC family protein [Mycolicibacterium doricum]MCV7269571.1 copper resistance protein CopC [Mycolicibacterium doricum]ORV44116.1 copper resistance protein CopC [Mycolicibacterium doricum]